jgi:hypothetical protein
MLPAIDEINSTLRATSEKRSGEAATVAESLRGRRSGPSAFRNGFMLMVIAASVAVLGYAMAPRIAQQIPGLAPTLTAFVTGVDAGRRWLDQRMQGASAALRGLSGDAAP